MSELDLDRDDAPPSPELAAVLDDARSAKPNVDWARVEAALFDDEGQVRAKVAAPKPARSRSWVAVAGALAIAAAFAVALVSPLSTRDDRTSTQPAAGRPPLSRDGTPISIGKRVDAGATGAWLRAEGRIAIHLAPGAVATVLDTGERIHLALERGSLAADVVPVPGGEPFAVDVAGRRVAVHGTRFRVAIVGDEVEVAVSEGNVVIGSSHGIGRTEGPLVAAGAIGKFQGDGAPTIVSAPELAKRTVDEALATIVPPPATTVAAADPVAPKIDPTAVAPAAPPAPKPTAVVTTEPSSPPPPAATVEPKPAPNGLTSEQIAGPLAKLDAHLAACGPSQGTQSKATFAADLTIRITPAGKAELEAAEPGLDTPQRDCVRSALGKLVFPTADAPSFVKKPIVLGAK